MSDKPVLTRQQLSDRIKNLEKSFQDFQDALRSLGEKYVDLVEVLHEERKRLDEENEKYPDHYDRRFD